LHAANADPGLALADFVPAADERALLLLAPRSTRATWDLVYGAFGADVVAIDELLGEIFRSVDVRRVFVAGFSGSASYALSLGLTNGDLFDGIVAFSPGFVRTFVASGKPRVFVSHGTEDRVIPTHATAARIVPSLREAGYDLAYHEFVGPHVVPPEI